MEKNVLRVLFSALGVVVLLGGLLAPVGISFTHDTLFETQYSQAQDGEQSGRYDGESNRDPRDLPFIERIVTTDLYETIGLIVNWILGFMGLIVFLIFLAAGFEYATAGADETKTGNATKRMTNAVIGLIIIFLAWILSGVVIDFVAGLGE